MSKIAHNPPGQRQDLRVPLVVTRVGARPGCPTFFGYAGDISSGGIFIRTANPKAVATTHHIAFVLPDVDAEIAVYASVAWSREYTSDRGLVPGMGMQFLDLSDPQRETINTFVVAVSERQTREAVAERRAKPTSGPHLRREQKPRHQPHGDRS